MFSRAVAGCMRVVRMMSRCSVTKWFATTAAKLVFRLINYWSKHVRMQGFK